MQTPALAARAAPSVLQWHNGRPTVPGTTHTLLSEPGAMPGYAYDLKALLSCPWAVTADADDGSAAVCGPKLCYAQRGRNQIPDVDAVNERRTVWTMRAHTRGGAALADWREYVTAAVAWSGYRDSYFRVHSRGDLFSPAYVQSWQVIAAANPAVRFWIPTRSWRALVELPAHSPSWQRWYAAFTALNTLPNVTTRPSGLYVNRTLWAGSALAVLADAGFAAPADVMSVRWGAAGELDLRGRAIPSGAYVCPKARQGGNCDPRDGSPGCRASWDAPALQIIHPAH